MEVPEEVPLLVLPVAAELAGRVEVDNVHLQALVHAEALCHYCNDLQIVIQNRYRFLYSCFEMFFLHTVL